MAVALAAALALAAPAAAELRLVTYNAWHGTWRTERNERLRFPAEVPAADARRFASQLDAVARLGPQVVFLQEVDPLPARGRAWSRQLGMAAARKTTDCGVKLFGFGVPTNLASGLVILAARKLDLERLGAVRLSGRLSFCGERFGFQLEEGRYALLARATSAGRRLLLASAHLHRGPAMPPERARGLARLVARGELAPAELAEIERRVERGRARRQAEAERLAAAAVAACRKLGCAAVVVGADLNATPEAPELEPLRGAGFRDAAAAASGVGATYDPGANSLARRLTALSGTGLPDFGSAAVAELLARTRDRAPRRIDHLLIAGGANASDAGTVLAARLLGPRLASGADASDHFGVVVDWRPPAP